MKLKRTTNGSICRGIGLTKVKQGKMLDPVTMGKEAMRGRNSTVISVRLPDRIVATLAERANKQDISIGEYIRQQIIKSCSVNATHSVNTIPLYNPRIHRTGDTVRMKDRTGHMVVVTMPELDADGNVIYD